MRYHVRIHKTIGYSLYVDAETEKEAEDQALDQWDGGDDGVGDEQETIQSSVAYVEQAPTAPASPVGVGQEGQL